jgi:hypothetical protein
MTGVSSKKKEAGTLTWLPLYLGLSRETGAASPPLPRS